MNSLSTQIHFVWEKKNRSWDFAMIFQEGKGNLEAQIDQLLNTEKQMRLSGDVAGTKKAVTEILQLCFEAKDWKTLNEQIVNLSKKRGQLKQVFICI